MLTLRPPIHLSRAFGIGGPPVWQFLCEPCLQVRDPGLGSVKKQSALEIWVVVKFPPQSHPPKRGALRPNRPTL
jgi:hypothetical protein